MAEIIIAILIHLSTIAGGVPADKADKEKASNDEKKKTEAPIKGSGGTGNWGENG